jgi:DNA polymerase-3 subunit alpha
MIDNIQKIKDICLNKIKQLNLGEEYSKKLDKEINDLKNYKKKQKDISERILSLVGKNQNTNKSGSLILFLIEASNLDPIRNNIKEIEKTISIAETPDIDTDIKKSCHSLIKEYITNTFGKENTCSIGTYQTYKTRAVIVDVARALGNDIHEVMSVTKKISPLASFDNEEDEEETKIDDMEFEEIYTHYPELKAYMEKYPEVERHCKVLRNQVKNMGKHAGGVIISNMNLQDTIPVYRGKEGEVISAWAEGQATHELSSIGLCKYDFLGLKALDIIEDTVKYVEKSRGTRLKKSDIDVNNAEAIKLGSRNDLVGIFQFENPATKPVVEAVKLESINDISAVTSLIRPGPRDMGMDVEYADRKHGRKEYKVIECLKPVLGETYGVIIYQEQIQLIAQVLSGFSPAESNKLRKVLIKEKNPEVLEKIKEKFINGAQQRIDREEVTKEEVIELFELCKSFANYGFNKCLTLDTITETTEGYKLLGEIKLGDKVKAPDKENKVKFVEVKNIFESESEVYEITLESGKTIQSSLNHKYLCEDGEMRRLEDIILLGHSIICEEEN